MKTIVVCPGLHHYYFNEVESTDVKVVEEPFLHTKWWISRQFQRFCKKMGWSFFYRCYLYEWKGYLEEADKCIIFDQAFSVCLTKALLKLKPELKIMLYLWNPVAKDITILERIRKVSQNIEVFSFDKKDCKKYGFLFSPMIYNLEKKYEKEANLTYDVLFVGYLKNRINMLTDIYNKLNNLGYRLYFHVLNNIHTKENTPFALSNDYLSYDHYKELLMKSDAVLDITQEGQIGLTIRTMETIAYKCKLITNNEDIETYSFYDPQNIFILGKQKPEDLKSFLNLPFKEINPEVLKEYNFTDWAKGLGELNK